MLSSILFHSLKHHLQCLRAWIDDNSGNLCSENILAIKTLGNSQLDVYCGNLSVDEILQQVSSFLHQLGIAENGQ